MVFVRVCEVLLRLLTRLRSSCVTVVLLKISVGLAAQSGRLGREVELEEGIVARVELREWGYILLFWKMGRIVQINLSEIRGNCFFISLNIAVDHYETIMGTKTNQTNQTGYCNRKKLLLDSTPVHTDIWTLCPCCCLLRERQLSECLQNL